MDYFKLLHSVIILCIVIGASVTIFLVLPSNNSALRWISSSLTCLVLISIILFVRLYNLLSNVSSEPEPPLSTRQQRPRTRVPHRLEFLRTPSLPSYENAVSKNVSKADETPPPTYNDINLPAWI